VDQNSMVFWWPKIEYIDIPKPKTIITWTGHRALQEMLDGKKLPPYLEKFILLAAEELRLPLFMRTDLASGKHDCYTDIRFIPMFKYIDVVSYII
jgi:hypothetical protein